MPLLVIVDDQFTNRTNLFAARAVDRCGPHGPQLRRSGDRARVGARQHARPGRDRLQDAADGRRRSSSGASASCPAAAEVPVIVITIYEERSFRLRALEAGATDFLQSPVDHHEFVTRARNLLKLRKQQLLLERKLEHSERSREEALRDSSERLAQVIDTVPAMVSATDRDGNFIFVNAYQASLTRVDPTLVGEVAGGCARARPARSSPGARPQGVRDAMRRCRASRRRSSTAAGSEARLSHDQIAAARPGQRGGRGPHDGDRHHRSQARREPPPVHGASRRADRPAQPHAAAQPPQPRHRARAPRRQLVCAAYRRPRRVQGGQRRARPFRRRQVPQARRTTPALRRQRAGHRGAARRRRVRRPADPGERDAGCSRARACASTRRSPGRKFSSANGSPAPPASGSPCIRATGRMPTSCSRTPIWRCIGPRATAATSTGSMPAT